MDPANSSAVLGVGSVTSPAAVRVRVRVRVLDLVAVAAAVAAVVVPSATITITIALFIAIFAIHILATPILAAAISIAISVVIFDIAIPIFAISIFFAIAIAISTFAIAISIVTFAIAITTYAIPIFVIPPIFAILPTFAIAISIASFSITTFAIPIFAITFTLIALGNDLADRLISGCFPRSCFGSCTIATGRLVPLSRNINTRSKGFRGGDINICGIETGSDFEVYRPVARLVYGCLRFFRGSTAHVLFPGNSNTRGERFGGGFFEEYGRAGLSPRFVNGCHHRGRIDLASKIARAGRWWL